MLKTFRRLPLLLDCLQYLPAPARRDTRQIFSLAERLFAEQDDERAMTEYKNYAYLEPAAVEAFYNDYEVLGGIHCFFESGWYGGDIYNAVNHAHRRNQNRDNEEKRELQERYGNQPKLGPDTGSLEHHGRF